jgi:hypothetical protein
MKYTCDFVHPKTGVRRTIVVGLDNELERQPARLARAREAPNSRIK